MSKILVFNKISVYAALALVIATPLMAESGKPNIGLGNDDLKPLTTNDVEKIVEDILINQMTRPNETSFELETKKLFAKFLIDLAIESNKTKNSSNPYFSLPLINLRQDSEDSENESSESEQNPDEQESPQKRPIRPFRPFPQQQQVGNQQVLGNQQFPQEQQISPSQQFPQAQQVNQNQVLAPTASQQIDPNQAYLQNQQTGQQFLPNQPTNQNQQNLQNQPINANQQFLPNQPINTNQQFLPNQPINPNHQFLPNLPNQQFIPNQQYPQQQQQIAGSQQYPPIQQFSPQPTTSPETFQEVDKLIQHIFRLNVTGILDQSLYLTGSNPVRSLLGGVLKLVFCDPISRLLGRCKGNDTVGKA